MPKKTARRIIDTRKATGTTILTGVTVSGSPGSGASAAMAGDGLTYDAGVLDVGAGTLITVAADSVGITAGSTYQYIGTGSGTAAAWQNVSTLAGAGLTHSAGVLAVGAGNGITVAADSVALTTPGTLTVATANNAASNHTHAITTSSNPGAAASILASTASGGLTLQSLAVQGSVDVTNGGDLTVAGSGSYAGSSVLFVDSSGGNVGIMGAPDPQFALDIVGPCRATWFVGPHAIQLKDALLIAHFDGRQPFESNFVGEPNGHMGQVATASNALFRPGKFDTKALQLAPATINSCSNPSFESATTGWSSGNTITRTTEQVYVGTYSLKATYGGSDSNMAAFNATLTATAYTASAWVYIPAASTLTAFDIRRENFTSATGDTIDAADLTKRDEWQRIYITFTPDAGDLTGDIVFRITGTSGAIVYIDAVQIEAQPYPTPYHDATMNGATLRSAGTLYYPISGNLKAPAGTIMMWLQPAASSGNQPSAQRYLQTSLNTTLDNEVAIYDDNSGGTLSARVADTSLSSSVSWTAGTWHHVAVTYDSTTVRLYVDGVEVDSDAQVSPLHVGNINRLYVCTWGTSGRNFNGVIDDLAITSSAIDADGIRAVYESDAPVFAESSRFSFRATPQGLVWADDEGLWMRNAAGSTVLGAYGGAATKSWAGLTLDPSDVVIGDSARGAYMLWDDSAGTLRLGKTGASTTSLYLSGTNLSFRVNATERVSLSGAGVLSIKDSGGSAVFTFDASAGAEFTKPLTIGTSGGIYQGTGTFASPTTGLKIWNDSGVGRMAGYNSSAVQWTIGTDGKFYSADSDGNTIRIDSGGMRVRMTSGSESFPGVIWCRPLDTSDIFTNYFGWLFGTYNTSTKVARQYVRSYVNTDTDSSYEARTIIEAQGKISGSTSGASMEVIRNRTAYYINMNAEWVGFSGSTQHGVFGSTPSATPATGYLVVWFSSSGSNYVLNVKNSGGTVKSVTLT